METFNHVPTSTETTPVNSFSQNYSNTEKLFSWYVVQINE